ncbi:MAG: S-layer homology domain-containing protein, partial [Candidatus Ornithomonoglobus sp.]
FPEMASDVSAIGIKPGAAKQEESNFYYRTSIEKALQLGLLHKDTDNNFKPTQTITVGEFARGIEKAFGLAENALTNYTKTYAELQSGDAKLSAAEEAGASIASAAVSNGNTEVTIENASSGVVIAVKYDNGIASQVKTAPVSGTTVTVEGIEADKIFVWNSLEEQKPMCSAYEISAAVTPTEQATEQATEQPTEPATEQPTAPATEQPTAPATEQPTEPAPEQPTDIPGDTCTVTVKQPTGGTVTVYNESAYHTATADIPSGVTANQVISDNAYFKLTAPSEIVEKKDSNGTFADNSAITTSAIEVRNNGTKQPSYEAKADGVLTLYLMFVDHKLITCENKTDNTSVQKYIDNTNVAGTTGVNYYNAVTFDVKAGNTYEVYTNGGTGRLFGVMYASTDYPQSTEALVVNKGDTVRITSIASENYVNDSILVNGAAVSTGKEAVITVNADTTVTATFTAEPAIVENTVIASDAALTREAMGAILYDAYQLVDDTTKATMSGYMTNNGGVPSPDDPNYDPNIQYEGTPYIPTTGWGALTDKAGLSDELYAKVKAAYNMGLIRPETGIARGSIALGSELEPTAEVTRAKAAKSLVFCFILTQPKSRPSHTVPEGFGVAEPSAITAPNTEAPKTVFIK